MEYKAFEAGIEVNGQTVYAIVDGFGIVKSLAKTHLRLAGLPEDIDRTAWYSQEQWLAAFKGIAKLYGNDTLFGIGLKIPVNAIFPPWVRDIHTAIQSIDIAYHMNHRKAGQVMFDPDSKQMLEGIGHYGYQPMAGENRILAECRNPYPCSFDRGILACMATKFAPQAKVTHDSIKPCRNKGGEACTYIVTW
ncbi:MAG: hypothetical protein ACREJ2_06680 [Planctomycetota bacterium]